MDYPALVKSLLNHGQYPILHEEVILDIYYKRIPLEIPPVATLRYDRRFDNPKDVYLRDSRPFELSYLVGMSQGAFCMNFLDGLPLRLGPLQCIPVRLCRSYIDSTFLGTASATFEEELYHFITLLNFDVPRVASVLDMDFMAATRFLPFLLNLRVCSYSTAPLPYFPVSEEERVCFGPREEEVLPIRMLSGRLSPATSRSTLLSLNNDLEFPARFTYLDHYVERYRTLIPLAYNPLENPIIDCRSGRP